jgi:excisionase family DNA binding protein
VLGDNESSELMTVAEVARELRVTPATIRSRIREGKLPAIRVGERGYRVRRSDLRRMIAFLGGLKPANGHDRPLDRAKAATPVDQEQALRPASRAIPPR